MDSGRELIRKMVEALRSRGEQVPSALHDLPGFPPVQYDHLRLQVQSGRWRLEKFATEYHERLFGILATSEERLESRVGLVIQFLGPLLSVVLSVFWTAWAILGVSLFFVGMSLGKRSYLRTIFRSAMTSEEVFCFLYFMRQIAIRDSISLYYWKPAEQTAAGSIHPGLSPHLDDWQAILEGGPPGAIAEIVKDTLRPYGISPQHFAGNLRFLETQGHANALMSTTINPMPTPSAMRFRYAAERAAGHATWFLAAFPDVASWISELTAAADFKHEPGAEAIIRDFHLRLAKLPESELHDANKKFSASVCRIMADMFREHTGRPFECAGGGEFFIDPTDRRP